MAFKDKLGKFFGFGNSRNQTEAETVNEEIVEQTEEVVEELSQPAIKLAREGFTANFDYIFSLARPTCDHAAKHSEYFKKAYMNNGEKYKFKPERYKVLTIVFCQSK